MSKRNLRPRDKLGSVSDDGNKNNDSSCCEDTDLELNKQIICSSCFNVFSNDTLNIDDTFFESLRLKKYKGVSWQCDKCTDKHSAENINIKQIICDMKADLKADLCNEIKKEIDSLNTTFLNKINAMLSKELITDSNKNKEVTSHRDLHDTQTKHTILVKPDINNVGEKFSSETWSDVVKKSIKPMLKNVPVTKSVITKNGKGVLFFPNQETRNEAAKNLKETCSIEVQDKNYKTILPKLKVSSIPKQYFDRLDCSVLKNEILEKNSTIKHLVENEKKTLDVIFINDETNLNHCYAVMKVDNDIKNAISAQGMNIYIGLSRCNVSDRYHLVQCFSCQNFGHRKNSDKCPLFNTNRSICLYCAGEHASKTCPMKKQKDKFKCSNCAASTDTAVRENCMGHSTTDRNCPVLQHALKMLMNRTIGATYRTDVPKNHICT